jgi:hypothetical protein
MNNLGFIPAWDQNYAAQANALTGLGDPIDALNAVFDSWWWKNRKLVVLGGVALLGLGVLGGIAAIVR